MKFDLSAVIGAVGVALVTTGLYMVSLPLALIVLGGFLIWATEKGE
jgi:hypothetical protein